MNTFGEFLEEFKEKVIKEGDLLLLRDLMWLTADFARTDQLDRELGPISDYIVLFMLLRMQRLTRT